MKQEDFWKKGLPYLGNKSQKAQQIIDALPQGKRLLDVFGGGGSISLHAASSGRWNCVVYNDKRTTVVQLLKALIENSPPINLDSYTYITRNQFFDWRNNQPDSIERTLVLLVWSFSYNEKDYLWAKTKEQLRLDLIQKYIVNGDPNLSIKDRYQQYLNTKNMFELRSIARLKRLELIQRLNVVLPLSYSCLDYGSLQVKKDDIVYCDPPYLNTRYRYNGFDNGRFYRWLNTLPTDNIFISERQMLPHTELYKDLGTKYSFSITKKVDHELLLKFIKY